MIKILFAASEGNPFIKTGGLADVVGAMPKYFDPKVYDIRIVLPKYNCIPDEYAKKMAYLTKLTVNMPREKEYIGIYEANVDGVHYYFIDNEYYFAGSAPYHEIYEDVNKFAYFCRAVLACLPKINYRPDIIHCHDWQTGLLPLFLKVFYKQKAFYKEIKTVMTIHNQKFQGRWCIEEIENCLDIPSAYRYGMMEAYGESNFLKAGIVLADRVTTVSKTYALEIQEPESGEGLDGVMREVAGKLIGITNGIDYEEYNPEKDCYIPYPFTTANIAQKKKNKQALQAELGIKKDSRAMLIGMVSRLTQQKGLDLVMAVLEKLLAAQQIQVVILGTGEERFQKGFQYFAWKYPDKVSVSIDYQEDIAHRIYAASDAFLMPSLFEPCGLSQLISMRYGTVPIVRETGGLKDTVEAYNQIWNTGNGFSFRNYAAAELEKMICYAVDVYKNHPKEWRAMMKRCMAADHSWAVSVNKYEDVYRALLCG